MVYPDSGYEKNLISLIRFEKALELIKKEKLIVDANWLPLIESAEAGDRMARHDISSGFIFGKSGLPQNYKLAVHYLMQLGDHNGEDDLMRFYSNRCLGDTHFRFGNFDEAKNSYTVAAKCMIMLPMTEWDFEMLRTLETLIEINQF